MRTNLERNNHNYCFLMSCLAGISVAAIALSIISTTIAPIFFFVGLLAIASCFKSQSSNIHAHSNYSRDRLFDNRVASSSIFSPNTHTHNSHAHNTHTHNSHAHNTHTHNSHAHNTHRHNSPW